MSDTINAVPIKYVGQKEIKTDSVNNTGTQWLQGQTVLYPAEKAARLLRHPDVWQLGDVGDLEEGVTTLPGGSGNLVSIDASKVVAANPVNVPGAGRTEEAGDDAAGAGTGISGSGTGDQESQDKKASDDKPAMLE